MMIDIREAAKSQAADIAWWGGHPMKHLML